MLYNPKECRERKKKVCPFFLLENSRPLSPWGPLDSLSTCLGNDSLKCMKVKSDSEVAQWCPTFASTWTVTHQAQLSMEFSRQQYWSWLPFSVAVAVAVAVKSLQSCPTLCKSRDGSPPGSPVPGILQARTLEWVAISFSSA